MWKDYTCELKGGADTCKTINKPPVTIPITESNQHIWIITTMYTKNQTKIARLISLGLSMHSQGQEDNPSHGYHAVLTYTLHYTTNTLISPCLSDLMYSAS